MFPISFKYYETIGELFGMSWGLSLRRECLPHVRNERLKQLFKPLHLGCVFERSLFVEGARGASDSQHAGKYERPHGLKRNSRVP